MTTKKRRLLTIAFAASLYATGCDRHAERESPPARPAGSGFRLTQLSQAGLAGRMSADASARRKDDSPRADAVLSALEAADVKVENPQQVLGTVVKATYCIAGRTRPGTVVAVCEYPDEASARGGRSISLEKFARAPDRDVLVHGALTLTLTGGNAGERERARVAFEHVDTPVRP